MIESCKIFEEKYNSMINIKYKNKRFKVFNECK